MPEILPPPAKLTTLVLQPNSYRSLAIALGAGILMGLTPAPYQFWPLAWVALAPLWVLVAQPTSLPVPLLALAWGVGYYGLALSWITGLHPLTWMGIPWLVSLAIVLFCWSFITLWGTAMVTSWAWLMRRLWQGCERSPIQPSPWLRLALGVALWCSLEVILSLGPLDWASLAYTQSPHNLLILHLGQLSGPTAATAAIVAVNGLLAEAWLSDPWRRTPQTAGKFLLLAVLLLTMLHGVGFALYRQPLVESETTALEIGLIQGNVPTRIKLYAEGLRQAISGYTSGYRTLAEAGVDAVLTPEGALPFLWEGSNKTNNAFYQAILEQRVPVWVGTFLHQGNRATQSLLTVDGNGETFSRYNKVKLVPLGEYTPFEQVLGAVIGRLSPIQSSMAAGDPNQRFDTPFGRAAVGICYESAFPELFRAQIADGAQFILTASNNDPYNVAMMTQHHAQDVMRAIEGDRWSVRTTNTGLSGIVDPHGHTRWLAPANTYVIHHHRIYRRQTRTIYVHYGNWLLPVLWLGVGAIGFSLRPQP